MNLMYLGTARKLVTSFPSWRVNSYTVISAASIRTNCKYKTFCTTQTKTMDQYSSTRNFYTKSVNGNILLNEVTNSNRNGNIWTLHFCRYSHNMNQGDDKSQTSALLYISSIVIVMIGIAYAAVPLYRLFCQATGLGGDPKLGHKIDMVETMTPVRERKINVYFNADHHAEMKWNFKPTQKEIVVVPGETALAFYTARNPTDTPIVGIATYNVIPLQAGLYFNKIQCFCFEEQWLNPHEEVDMPVFFYIDPEFDNDPALAEVDDIILSYTFFKAEKGQTLPLPGFMKLGSVQNVNQPA